MASLFQQLFIFSVTWSFRNLFKSMSIQVLWSFILCPGVYVPFRLSALAQIAEGWWSSRYCPLALLKQVCLGGGHPIKTVASDSSKDWSCQWSSFLLFCRFFLLYCRFLFLLVEPKQPWKPFLLLLLGLVHQLVVF